MARVIVVAAAPVMQQAFLRAAEGIRVEICPAAVPALQRLERGVYDALIIAMGDESDEWLATFIARARQAYPRSSEYGKMHSGS